MLYFHYFLGLHGLIVNSIANKEYLIFQLGREKNPRLGLRAHCSEYMPASQKARRGKAAVKNEARIAG
jgi:hypothetical protein